MSYRILVGAQGWQHDAWRSNFYPADLPQEWELTYYSTQLRCVYLPYTAWTSACRATLETWLKETRPDFRFVLGAAEKLEEKERKWIGSLGEQAVIEPDITNGVRLEWFPLEPDLKKLSREITRAVEKREVLYLFNREAHWPSIEQVRTLIEVMGC
jgi:hypothetical protein